MRHSDQRGRWRRKGRTDEERRTEKFSLFSQYVPQITRLSDNGQKPQIQCQVRCQLPGSGPRKNITSVTTGSGGSPVIVLSVLPEELIHLRTSILIFFIFGSV